MAFQARIPALVSCCAALAVALLCSLSPAQVSAQSRPSAAQLSAPAPALSEVVGAVPAAARFVVAVDGDACIDALAAPLNDFGLDGDGLLRAALDSAAESEIPSSIPIQPSRGHRLVLAGTSNDHSAIVITDDGAWTRADIPSDGTSTRLGGEAMAMRRGRMVVVGEGSMFDALSAPDPQPFSLATTWPAASTAFPAEPVFWAYMADPELLNDIDRELYGMVSRSGVRRFAFGAAADGSYSLVLDATRDAVEEGLGRIRSSSAALVRSEAEDAELSDYPAALLEQAWRHLRVEGEDGAVVVSMPAPQCGGPVQQIAALAIASVAWLESESEGLAADAAWPSDAPLAVGTCPSEIRGPASLPWHLGGAVAENESVVSAMIDAGAAFRTVAFDAGGLAPFALDPEGLAAVTPERLRGLVDGPMPIFAAAWGPELEDGELLVGPVEFASSLEEVDAGAEVEGVGWVSGSLPEGYSADAPLPATWERWRSAVPEDSPVALIVSGAVLRAVVTETPAMLRGATTAAMAASDAAIFVLSEGRPSLRLLGVDAATAERMQAHVRGLVTDAGVTVGAAQPTFAPFQNQFELLAARFVVEPFEDGVEIRLDVEPNAVTRVAMLLAVVGFTSMVAAEEEFGPGPPGVVP